MLNKAMLTGATALHHPAPCDTFSLVLLQSLEKVMFHLRDESLLTTDLRAPRHTTLEHLDAAHGEEQRVAGIDEEQSARIRFLKCHDIAMAWTHHLSAGGRAKLSLLSLPLLPDLDDWPHAGSTVDDETPCVVAHRVQSQPVRQEWPGFPTWPAEVTYEAEGYGIYPFWIGGSDLFHVRDESRALTQGSRIRTRWSSLRNSARMEHEACLLTKVATTEHFSNGSLSGSPGWKADASCVHLETPSHSYLYDAEETHCCIASNENCVPSFSTFSPYFPFLFDQWELRDYAAESANFEGRVNATYRVWQADSENPGPWFWYFTDLFGFPVEQGEGNSCGFQSRQRHPATCDLFEGRVNENQEILDPYLVYRQYNRTTFREAYLTDDDFAVPVVCQATQSLCIVEHPISCYQW
jgi:hypothetical protein